MTNLFIAAAVLVIASVICIVMAFKKSHVWLFILGLIIFSLGLVFFVEGCEDYLAKKVMNGSYVVYIDGVEVDKTKIDLGQYRLTFNEEEHEVYATSR